MFKSEILEGNILKDRISMPTSSEMGVSLIGEDVSIPLTNSVLSKHLLYTGTIGTGKTTAMFQLLHQLILGPSPSLHKTSSPGAHRAFPPPFS